MTTIKSILSNPNNVNFQFLVSIDDESDIYLIEKSYSIELKNLKKLLRDLKIDSFRIDLCWHKLNDLDNFQQITILNK
jgi:hypothetical protein